MREIVPDVLTWSRPSERHGYDFNGPLLRHPEGNLFRARLGARTAIHPKDADYARGQGAEIDDALEVGDHIGPLYMVPPGKSPGEVVLFWQERKLLIIGDAMIGNPPGRPGAGDGRSGAAETEH